MQVVHPQQKMDELLVPHTPNITGLKHTHTYFFTGDFSKSRYFSHCLWGVIIWLLSV